MRRLTVFVLGICLRNSINLLLFTSKIVYFLEISKHYEKQQNCKIHFHKRQKQKRTLHIKKDALIFREKLLSHHHRLTLHIDCASVGHTKILSFCCSAPGKLNAFFVRKIDQWQTHKIYCNSLWNLCDFKQRTWKRMNVSQSILMEFLKINSIKLQNGSFKHVNYVIVRQ